MTTQLSFKKTFYTIEEFLALPDDGQRYELVKGELVEMSQPGFKHGVVVGDVTTYLRQFVVAHKAGLVTSGSGYVIDNSNPKKPTVRAPDVAFVSAKRLVETDYDPDKPFPQPPDLAIEVVSPNDVWTQVDDKVDEYLKAGVRLVLVIYPRRKAVFIYHLDQPLSLLVGEAELEGEDVVPEFKLKLGELFK